MKNLIWFRSDLRTDDNPALNEAIRSSSREGVVAVFFCCPRQWREHHWGAPKVDFVLRTLESLSKDLERAGIGLLIETVPSFSEVPKALLDVAKRHECNRLFYNVEYEVNERKRDEKVGTLLDEHGIEVRKLEEQTVLPPDSLRTGKGDFYTVFSPFRRAWAKKLEEVGIPSPEPLARSLPEPVSPRTEVPETLPPFEGFAGRPLWPAEATEAHTALERFVDERIESYADKRDLASEDGTSALSPYLAIGSLSIRRCLASALAANRGRLEGGNKGIDTWISELVWREFYRHVMVGYPRVSMNRAFKEETESIVWRSDPEAFEAWCAGRTGVPYVDAGLRQLLATGWMHNRLRMVTAMFLTKDLLLDWRLGEAHFMRHLIDADLANNNGGWQWSASTGTDAAPYFRIFNPWTQGKKYDPDGDYIRRWVPELAKIPAAKLHDPKGLSSIDHAALDYPEPIVDHRSARIRALEAFKKRDRTG